MEIEPKTIIFFHKITIVLTAKLIMFSQKTIVFRLKYPVWRKISFIF